MRLLDLFCGRCGWAKVFAARGWKCIVVDLIEPPEIPQGCEFYQQNVMDIDVTDVIANEVDFICASSPCEQFSVHGMKHFHPNPPYPELGIKLFNHTRQLCEASGVPYVMENVRAAQQFVGNAVHHWGPFYLWGNAVPVLAMQGVKKNYRGNGTVWASFAHLPSKERRLAMSQWDREHFSSNKKEAAREVAQIPPELANCVADYAERLLEMKGNKQCVTF